RWTAPRSNASSSTTNAPAARPCAACPRSPTPSSGSTLRAGRSLDHEADPQVHPPLGDVALVVGDDLGLVDPRAPDVLHRLSALAGAVAHRILAAGGRVGIQLVALADQRAVLPSGGAARGRAGPPPSACGR